MTDGRKEMPAPYLELVFGCLDGWKDEELDSITKHTFIVHKDAIKIAYFPLSGEATNGFRPAHRNP